MPIPVIVATNDPVSRQLAAAQVVDAVKPGFVYSAQVVIAPDDFDWYTLNELYLATPGTRRARPIDSVMIKAIAPTPDPEAVDDPFLIEIGGFYHALSAEVGYPWNGYPLGFNDPLSIVVDSLEAVSVRVYPANLVGATIAFLFSSRAQ